MNEPPDAPPNKSNTGLIIGLVVGGVVLLGIVGGGCLLGIMLPALSKARETARDLKSQTQARVIWSAAMHYEARYNAWPSPGSDLGAVLVPEYLDPEMLVSPFAPPGSKGPSYRYVAPIDPKRSDNPIVVYEDPSIRPGARVTVVRLNGEIGAMTEPELLAALKAEAARVARPPDE